MLVTGFGGQVATSLLEAARPRTVDVLARGRPHLDLADRSSIEKAVAGVSPDVIVNAGAYTAVDKAESEEDVASAVNGLGAGYVAEIAAGRGIPLVHVSTDYVFDGTKTGPYVETDPAAPVSAYGRSKLDGERRVAAAGGRFAIVRTSWVHSPHGSNFVKTMLRLASGRPEIAVVADQHGCPTYAPHLAATLLAVAAKLLAYDGAPRPAGVYHAAGTGETTWAGLAAEVFRISRLNGGPHAAVKPIATAEYPTPARRPANSVLDCSRLARECGIALPDWQSGVADCVTRILKAAG